MEREKNVYFQQTLRFQNPQISSYFFIPFFFLMANQRSNCYIFNFVIFFSTQKNTIKDSIISRRIYIFQNAPGY